MELNRPMLREWVTLLFLIRYLCTLELQVNHTEDEKLF